MPENTEANATPKPDMGNFIKGALIALAIGIVILAFYKKYFSEKAKNKQIDNLMNKAVGKMESGKYTEAESLFMQAFETARRSLDKARKDIPPHAKDADNPGKAFTKASGEAFQRSIQMADAGFFLAATKIKLLEKKYAKELARATTEKDFRFFISPSEMKEIKKIINIGLAAQPRHEKLYRALGYVESMTGKYAAAIRALEKALEINPRFAEAYNDMGVVLMKRKQFEKARENFEKALLALDKDRQPIPDLYFNLGLYYANTKSESATESEKNRSSALEHLKKYVELSKKPSASLELAQKYIKELSRQPMAKKAEKAASENER